jgi:hypothetical protein
MKYRKKPVVVDAARWWKNGDHPDDFTAERAGFESGQPRMFSGAEARAEGWEGGVVRYFRRPDVPGIMPCINLACSHTMRDHGWIDAPGSGHTVCPGDWIVTDAVGDHYPVKPTVFDADYELVEPEGGPTT